MPREFPLVRSFHNLVWNIRHYRHPSHRPSFRASRHPFCTNIQLRDASCAFWVKETTRDLGARLKTVLTDPAAAYKSHQTKQISTRLVKLHPAALYSPYGAQKRHSIDPEEAEAQSVKDRMVSLFKEGKYKDLNILLQEYKRRGSTLPVEALEKMVEEIRAEAANVSEDQEYLYRSEIETPWFVGKNDIKAAAKLSKVYPKIPKLFDAFKILYPGDYRTLSPKVLQNGIWLCYHMDDSNTMQQMLFAYLQQANFDSKTLSYAINNFTLNYDVQFAKTLFQSIIDIKKPLDGVLLSTTITSLIKVGAIFENVDSILQSWLKAENCSSPDVKTMALLYKHYLRFGSQDEISKLTKSISDMGFGNHYLISMVKLHSDIMQRTLSPKKQLTEDDVSRITHIRNSIAYNRSALTIYYESTLAFLARHSSASMIQLVVKEMMADGVQPSKFAYDVIIQHYIADRRFIPVLSLMKTSMVPSMEFNPSYVKYLFDAFVKAYPYEGEHIYHRLQSWLQSAENKLDLASKQRILMACRIANVESSIAPFAVQSDRLKNDRKYDSPEWNSLKHSLLKKLKWKNRKQVNFRVSKGFRDLLRKGVKPDYQLLENTLRKSKYEHRVCIIESLGQMRMHMCKPRLLILHETMNNPSKHQLQEFARKISPLLTASDKIFLSRRLMNKNAFDEASDLLNSITEWELTDQQAMVLLNFKLRNDLGRNKFESFDETIESFPIDRITLSPYLLKQCCFIEKALIRKIKASESSVKSKLHDMTETMKNTLSILTGLIGDIELRLKSDKKDLGEKAEEMFHMLDEWIRKSNRDEY